jgi:hypothetical protein
MKKIANYMLIAGIGIGVGSFPAGMFVLSVIELLYPNTDPALSWVVFYYVGLAMMYIAAPLFVLGLLLKLLFWRK